MSVQKCPDCGHDLSNSARRCPNCNHYVWSTGRKLFALFFVAVALVVIIAGLM